MEAILTFEGEFAFLSNFYMHPVVDRNGKLYRSGEHAYQAMKTTVKEWIDAICNAERPGKAKRLGRECPCRPEWEQVIDPATGEKFKDMVMYKVEKAKYAPGSELAKKLLATGDAYIQEGNSHGDRYWGCVWEGGKWVGKNKLGLILMRVRAELRAEMN